MEGYYTYPESKVRAPRRKRIAVVTQGVKLGDETRGYTRFRFIAQTLAEAGFDVDLVTSTFQHWDKAQRDTTRPCYKDLPYRIQFIYEPGYKRNLDLARINSHRVLAGNLRRFFQDRFASNPCTYDLIYSEIPPNDMARTCAEIAHENGIPYVPDINDLWPEAMRMAVDVPVLSDIAFSPFARDAKKTYNLIAAAVGTSDEYANQPSKYRDDNYRRITVYVGNELEKFDSGAAAQADAVEKPDGELWAVYAGTLGASYDIATLIDASIVAAKENPSIRVKILGDGPDRAKLEEQAARMNAPVDFVGYAPYELMAAYLKASDITVNSLVKSAPQSIITKIGDYLAAGIPMINTGSSPEFRSKVEADGFGINVEAEDVELLAKALVGLANDEAKRCTMGAIARRIAEEQFDQPTSYQAIVELISSLV